MADSTFDFSRVLVTGAGGFVGAYLLPAITKLLKPGAEITLGTRDGSRYGDVHKWVKLDLCEPGSIAAAINRVRPDLVIHLAAQSSVGKSVKEAAATWSVNFGGCFLLAREISKIVPTCTVLFVSSVEVYGTTFNSEIASELSPLRPQSPYSKSKASAELMFADVLPVTAKLIVARPCNHTGPLQGEEFVIPSFAAQIARVESGSIPAVLVGNLDAERDFLDVRDVVDAYIALLNRVDELPSRSTFNIASGRTVKVRDLLQRLVELSSQDVDVVTDPLRLRRSEVPRASIDATAIKQFAGWEPRRPIDKMLSDVLTYQRIHNAHPKP